MPAKVLVVDDSPLVTDMLKAILEKAGYQTFVARDGFQALEIMKSNPPDLMLLDIEMPKMDGWTLLKEIRFKAVAQKKFPVVMLTSKGKLSDISFLEGADGFLEKTPANLQSLPEKVEEYLKKAGNAADDSKSAD